MSEVTYYIYFAGEPDESVERIYPESGQTVTRDEGGVVVTSEDGKHRRIYPWHAVRAIYEEYA